MVKEREDNLYGFDMFFCSPFQALKEQNANQAGGGSVIPPNQRFTVHSDDIGRQKGA